MNTVQISLTTSDLEKLKNFYIEVFEFVEFGGWDKPDQKLRAVKLMCSEIVIEIIESKNLQETHIPFSMHKSGWNMIGFNVSDISEVIEKVKTNGGKLSQPISPGVSVKEIAFVLDPDGNGIELITPRKSIQQKLKFHITEYDRNELWSTGNLTPDLKILAKYFENGLYDFDLEQEEVQLAIKKVGDICGCPVPDKVATREGEIGAFNYLFSLSVFYNEIKEILDDCNLPFSRDWGKSETRNLNDEPMGEDLSRLPEIILKNNIVRGPGKYQEFAITRLMWIDKQEKNLSKKVGLNKIKELISNAKSLDEFQIDLIAEMAITRFDKESIEDLISNISKGIVHEGFFKQNNPYTQVGRIFKLLKQKYSSQVWFAHLEKEVERILNLPVTKFN